MLSALKILLIGIGVFSVFLMGCTDKSNKETALSDYAKINGLFQKINAQKDSAINKEIAPLEAENTRFRNEYSSISANERKKISEIEKEKYTVSMKYDQDLAKTTKQHELVHGHFITAEYEKKLNDLENKKNKQISNYNKQIEQLKLKTATDQDIVRLKSQMEEISIKIDSVKRAIQQQFNYKINKTQKEVDLANRKLEQIIESLPGKEKTDLINKRDRIRTLHCQ